MTYYNTNHETGETLKQSRVKVNKQEEEVLGFFRAHSLKHFTANDVLVLCFKKTVPLSSVGRSLRNLVIGGHIVKTNVMREGVWGKQVHTWKCRQKEATQTRIF